MDSKTLLQI